MTPQIQRRLIGLSVTAIALFGLGVTWVNDSVGYGLIAFSLGLALLALILACCYAPK